MHPDLLEGDLVLTHYSQLSGVSGTSAVDGTTGGGDNEDEDVLNGGVVWTVTALPLASMEWTIFRRRGCFSRETSEYGVRRNRDHE